MFRLFFYKNLWIFFLFSAPIVSVVAQETRIYDQFLKESLKSDFMKMAMPLDVDSNNTQLFKDFNEENLYKMLFRHRIEFLLPKEKVSHLEDKEPKLSPYATLFFYTNSKNEPLNNGKFNGDGSFTGEFAMKGDVLMSKSTRVMVSVPVVLLFLATKTGIIPAENTNKESKKDKMLKTIKEDVYHEND